MQSEPFDNACPERAVHPSTKAQDERPSRRAQDERISTRIRDKSNTVRGEQPVLSEVEGNHEWYSEPAPDYGGKL
jgi:hypothetical protein